MIPVLEALQALLISNDDIAAAVDDGDGGYRIYGPRRTMPELTPPLPKTIVLQRVGGRREATVPIIRPRVYVRCYAEDVVGAEALYGLLSGAFYDTGGRMRGAQQVQGWRLFWAELSEPTTAIEPESGWPVASGVLLSEWAAVAVA